MKPRNPDATGKPSPSPTPKVDALVRLDPDLVDRIFDYLVALAPEIAPHHGEIKTALRDEFATNRAYVRRRGAGEANPIAAEVLRLFNGRNATEVARVLQIHRATVYRYLKQPGRR
jgi:transcriptional regulator of acetoin/glycerol metabolism